MPGEGNAGTCWLYCKTPRGGWWPPYLEQRALAWYHLASPPALPSLTPSVPQTRCPPVVPPSTRIHASQLSWHFFREASPSHTLSAPAPLRVCCRHPVYFLHCISKICHYFPGSLVTGSPYMGALRGWGFVHRSLTPRGPGLALSQLP